MLDLLIESDQEKILKWLATPEADPSITHNRLLEEHHEKTGQWFLESEKFKTWLETPSGVLWIYGIRTSFSSLELRGC